MTNALKIGDRVTAKVKLGGKRTKVTGKVKVVMPRSSEFACAIYVSHDLAFLPLRAHEVTVL